MATKPSKARKRATPTTTTVGANVYRLRVLRAPKMSQQGLANLSGVSVETIRLLERNRIPRSEQLSPHLDTIDKLAAALGVEASTLFEDNQATPSKPTGRRDHLRVVPGTGDGLPAVHRL